MNKNLEFFFSGENNIGEHFFWSGCVWSGLVWFVRQIYTILKNTVSFQLFWTILDKFGIILDHLGPFMDPSIWTYFFIFLFFYFLFWLPIDFCLLINFFLLDFCLPLDFCFFLGFCLILDFCLLLAKKRSRKSW